MLIFHDWPYWLTCLWAQTNPVHRISGVTLFHTVAKPRGTSSAATVWQCFAIHARERAYGSNSHWNFSQRPKIPSAQGSSLEKQIIGSCPLWGHYEMNCYQFWAFWQIIGLTHVNALLSLQKSRGVHLADGSLCTRGIQRPECLRLRNDWLVSNLTKLAQLAAQDSV